jgi:DNA-binding response OmpR family regulator
MNYKILVVDDNKATANSLAELLQMLGHQVRVAYGPRGALHQFYSGIPDLLFLDLNMPIVNGLDICRYLRSQSATAKMPIIVISANEEQSYKDAASRAGANYYIVKPAMLDDLEKAIENVMVPAAK